MLDYRNTTSAGYKVAVIPLMGTAGDRSLNRKAPVSLEPLHGNTTVIHADFLRALLILMLSMHGTTAMPLKH